MKLYLIPSPISDGNYESLPKQNLQIIAQLHYFFVENRKQSIRLIKHAKQGTPPSFELFRLRKQTECE